MNFRSVFNLANNINCNFNTNVFQSHNASMIIFLASILFNKNSLRVVIIITLLQACGQRNGRKKLILIKSTAKFEQMR